MFIQAKVLYLIATEGENDENRGSLIYDALQEKDLIDYFYKGKSKQDKISILSCLPSKTIFSKNKQKYFVSLPFISSHLTIPVNIGEYIWIHEYNLQTKGFYNSFWLSRVHSLFNVENQSLTEKEEESNLFDTISSGLEKERISTDSFFKTNDLCLKGTNSSKILFSRLDEEELDDTPEEILITSGEDRFYFLNSKSSLLVTENLQKNYIEKFFSSGFFIKNNKIHNKIEEKISIKDFIGLEKESLLKEKLFVKNTVSIKEKKSQKLFIKNVPSACITSTNVMILSENNKEKNSGGIYLIQNNLNNNFSELSLRKDGKIFVNSDKILIGNLDRRSKDSIDPIIYLGYNEESSSIVKGEYLRSLLLELIEINKESLSLISKALEEIKINFDTIDSNFESIDNWASTHLHNSTAPGSPTSKPILPIYAGSTANLTKDIEASSKKNGGEEIERLQDLIKNIDKILSKFVKTV